MILGGERRRMETTRCNAESKRFEPSLRAVNILNEHDEMVEADY
jgi:hypothetical protein